MPKSTRYAMPLLAVPAELVTTTWSTPRAAPADTVRSTSVSDQYCTAAATPRDRHRPGGAAEVRAGHRDRVAGVPERWADVADLRRARRTVHKGPDGGTATLDRHQSRTLRPHGGRPKPDTSEGARQTQRALEPRRREDGESHPTVTDASAPDPQPAFRIHPREPGVAATDRRLNPTGQSRSALRELLKRPRFLKPPHTSSLFPSTRTTLSSSQINQLVLPRHPRIKIGDLVRELRPTVFESFDGLA